MKKSRVKKNKKNNSKTFKIIEIIALILIIAISIIFLLKKDSSLDKKTENIIQPPECLAINLIISEINPSTNMLKITRLTGTGDLNKIKLFVNENPVFNLLASDLKEGLSKIFIVDISPEDKVEIAPILKDGTICAVSDTKIA